MDFINFAKNGDLESLKKFSAQTRDVYNQAFIYAAKNGRLEVCKWLMQFNVDIHANVDYVGNEPSETREQPMQSDIDIHDNDDYVRNGHLEAYKWLVESEVNAAFRLAAIGRHLGVLKWLWLQTEFDSKILELEEVKRHKDELKKYEWNFHRSKTTKSAHK